MFEKAGTLVCRVRVVTPREAVLSRLYNDRLGLRLFCCAQFLRRAEGGFDGSAIFVL